MLASVFADEDLVSVIWRYLSTKDKIQFRYVIGKVWTSKDVFDTSYEYLQCHKPKYLQKCAECSYDCLTQIVWNHSFQKVWIPWCIMHTKPEILNDIELYCIGNLYIEGLPMIIINIVKQ